MPERRQPFARLAANPHWAPALLPEGEEPGLRETAFWTAPIARAKIARERGFAIHDHSLYLYADCLKADCPDRPKEG